MTPRWRSKCPGRRWRWRRGTDDLILLGLGHLRLKLLLGHELLRLLLARHELRLGRRNVRLRAGLLNLLALLIHATIEKRPRCTLSIRPLAYQAEDKAAVDAHCN